MALTREWIIFALCLGAGGHLALGFVLHAPDLWPWSRAGLYGLLSGLVIYVLVQVARFLWSRVHAKRSDLEQDAGD
jgi:NhaP-type Na+/H+ or K+/H+ antiporter